MEKETKEEKQEVFCGAIIVLAVLLFIGAVWLFLSPKEVMRLFMILVNSTKFMSIFIREKEC